MTMMRFGVLLSSVILLACGGGEPVDKVEAAEPVTPRAPVVVDEVAPRVPDAALKTQMRSVIRRWVDLASKLTKGKASSENVRVALHVRERGREGELVSISSTRAQAPASNMKLVTSAAALCLLGPDWNFQTRFAADGPIENGSLRGDLVVFAGGDPLYDRDAAGNVDAWLEPVATKLSESGIRTITGNLVLDEGTFELPSPAPGWPDASQYWQDYCALPAGFTANAGCVTATVTPTSVGQSARVQVEPREHGLPERIAVKTAKKKSRLNVVVGANQGRVIVRGEMPSGAEPWESSFSHPDPVVLFGASLRGALAAKGITLQGEVVRERGRESNGLRDLAILASPLLDTLVPINTDSNNPVTEQVLLALGNAVQGAGTRAGGADAVRLGLERLGVSASGFVQSDGSGLSRENRVSAAQLTALLNEAMSLDSVSAQAFRDSLAIGGRTGTLEKRLKHESTRGRVFAKTGWISGVSALSGVVLDGQERELIFSILVEYPRLGGLNSSCWKPMQDELCQILAAYAD